MVPMWIVGLLAPALTWLALYFDSCRSNDLILLLVSAWTNLAPMQVGGRIGCCLPSSYSSYPGLFIIRSSRYMTDSVCKRKKRMKREKDQLAKRKAMRERTEEAWKGRVL